MLSIGDGQQGFKLEAIEKDEEMIAKTLSMALSPEEEEHTRAQSESERRQSERR